MKYMSLKQPSLAVEIADRTHAFMTSPQLPSGPTMGPRAKVRLPVTKAGAWKHKDFPAPVGATKNTSRFDSRAFMASS